MIRTFLVALIFSVFFSLPTNATEKPITIEVTGETVGSDLESPRELFERAKAGRMYHFPPADSSIRLTAQLLPESKRSGAEERIKIIATSKEEPLLHGGFKEGFKVYDGKSTGLVSDLLKRLAQLDQSDWGETTLLYRIAPKR